METFFDYNVSPTNDFRILTFPVTCFIFKILVYNNLHWKLWEREYFPLFDER